MRFDYVKPFLEALQVILPQVVGGNVLCDGMTLLPKPLVGGNVAVVVGLAGDVEGCVTFGMSEKTALGIASAMNFEKFSSIDALAKSTLCELANMVTGFAVTCLADRGFKFDLTPPAIVVGEMAQELVNKNEAVFIRANTRHGAINSNVSIRDLKN